MARWTVKTYYKKNVEEIESIDFDTVILCVPDDKKIQYISYFTELGCNIMVEKPILGSSDQVAMLIKKISEKNLILYTAYNHRFEPHFVTIKDYLEKKEFGEIYSLRMHYGNGTSNLVTKSPWRDFGLGIISDIGSHLLDLLIFWFGITFTKELLGNSRIEAMAKETSSPDNLDRKSTRLNSSHIPLSRMPSSA